MNQLLFTLLLLPLLSTSIEFSISPKTLKKSNDPLTIQWSGILSPQVDDNITISIVSGEKNQVIGVFLLSEQCESWENGFGMFTVPWLNLRHDFLLELNVEEHRAVKSAVVMFEDWNEPLQGHLSLTGNVTEMRVMWVTHNTTKGTVRYGLSEKSFKSISSLSTSYAREDLCSSPANDNDHFLNPGIIHTAVMTNLVPGKTYYYQFGAQDQWSNIFTFVAAPDSLSQVDGVLYGDMGVGTPFTPMGTTTQQMALLTAPLLNDVVHQSKTPFAFHIGDISYARGHAFLWEYFFDLIQSIATRAPYMVLIGNHEFDHPEQEWKPVWSNYGTDSGGECGIPYFKRFQMPLQTTSTESGLWYSFDFGPIHFTAISTEHNFLPGSDQYKWIKKDLESVDRNKTPWVVFTGHRPFYTSTEQGTGHATIEHLRESLEPLVLENKVDVCFWGHVHHYERTCHYANNKCQKQGDAPVHVVIGNAGNSYQANYQPSPDKSHFDQPKHVIFRTANFGFGKFIANQTHFTWQFVGDMSGIVHDQFTLTK